MKKFIFKKAKIHWLRMISKRTKRKWHFRDRKHSHYPDSKPKYDKNNVKRKGIQHIIEVKAPTQLLLHSPNQHKYFMEFIYKIEKLSKQAINKKVRLSLDFGNTTHIYPDACVLLIATMDNIKHLYPYLKFKIRKPIRNPNSIFDPHAVLCHLGFYKLLGLNYQVNCSSKYVKCWQCVSSNLTDGQITEPLINELKRMGINTSFIYRSYLEGIANAVEHAYINEIELTNPYQLKKWWMLLARLDNRLLLFVCDKGHGIPKTLPYKNKGKILEKLKEKIKNLTLGKSDCLYIKAYMLVKEIKNELAKSETRTELSYRGKGKYDIRSFIDKTENSKLIIYSNKGTLEYKGDVGLTRAICYDNELSINGTILQWVIPIKD